MDEEDLRRGIADSVVEMHRSIGGLSRDTAGLIAARIREGDEDIRTIIEQRDDARERVRELEAELQAVRSEEGGQCD